MNENALAQEALLLQAFDEAIVELDAAGMTDEAEQIRNVRLRVEAIFDQHRAWLADPQREMEGG